MLAELIEDVDALAALAEAWDGLASAARAPLSTPAWMLGWWRHVAPPDASLRVVAVRERGELIGLAPFYVLAGEPFRYRLLADTFASSLTPLAAPDRVWEVAAAVAAAVADASPPPGVVELGPVPASSPWPLALREGWPGRVRPLAFQVGLEPTATVVLDGSFDAWLAGRGAQFRKAVRRRSRAFERDEGVFRLSTPDRTAADIATFVRLHEARWAGRGDSRLLALGPRLPALLGELAASLGDGRFRLWLAELDGEPVCADLSIVAGGEVVGVNTGWDERFKRYAPVQLATVHKLRDCWARRERRLDMGWGSLEYKRAFADGNDPVAWYRLVPVSRRLPRAVGAVAPAVAGRRLRQGLRRALPAEHTGRLRALQDRARVRRSRRGPS